MFDFGIELDSADTVSHFRLWPTTGERTALIDGDMLPYIVGHGSDEHRATYDEDGKYLAERCNVMDALLNSWVTGAICDSAIIYITGDTNFRNEVAIQQQYKGTRKAEKPPFFKELRYHLWAEHNAIMSDNCEADDLMSIKQTSSLRDSEEMERFYAQTVIVSKDKDLRIVRGYNCNPTDFTTTFTWGIGELEPEYRTKEAVAYTVVWLKDGEPYQGDDEACIDRFQRGPNKGKPKTKRIKNGTEIVEYIHKLRGSGLSFFYAQCIMGDTVDGYSGLKGAGGTLAYMTLKDCETELELYEATLSLYREKLGDGINVTCWDTGLDIFLTPELMLREQARLAWMQEKEGELWRPPN
jgi:hypothetical protein